LKHLAGLSQAASISMETIWMVKKMRYIGNTPDLAKLKEFAKIQG